MHLITLGFSLEVHAQEEIREETTDDLQKELEQETISNESSEDMGTWLLAPKLSNGPKFGLLLGASINHVIRLDNGSPPTISGFTGSYSNTRSFAFAAYHRSYWDIDTKRVSAFIAGLRTINEYEDFLSQGKASVENDYKIFYSRYQSRVTSIPFFVGGSYTYADINPHAMDPNSVLVLQQNNINQNISAGIGLNLTYDSRNIHLSPTAGIYIESSVSLYDRKLGGDSDYWSFYLNHAQYIHLFSGWVLAYNLSLLSTPDAPASSQATLRDFRGYTTGEFVAENAVIAQTEVRIPIGELWKATAFGGIGTLLDYGAVDAYKDYPMYGIGFHYTLDQKSGAIVRFDFADGYGSNQAFYLHFGQAF